MEGLILGSRYELIKKIGSGGMAEVYKARCRLLNRFVAIKILRQELANDEDFIKRFKVEAQSVANLSHPNIVSVMDVGFEKGYHYIVMELVDGYTLKDLIIEKGVIDWKSAVEYAICICKALEQAHKNKVIHRDIKPQNILISNKGDVKVADFGIARLSASTAITMVGTTLGSVHYYSPEQAKGSAADYRTDLYSLGVVLYEMVTGTVPFNGETPVSIALKHIQDEPKEPISINKNIPKELNDLIMKAMKKEPSARFDSAASMRIELENILELENVETGKQSDNINYVNNEFIKEENKVENETIKSKPDKSIKVKDNSNNIQKNETINNNSMPSVKKERVNNTKNSNINRSNEMQRTISAENEKSNNNKKNGLFTKKSSIPKKDDFLMKGITIKDDSMQKKIIIAIVAILVVLFGGYFLFSKFINKPDSNNTLLTQPTNQKGSVRVENFTNKDINLVESELLAKGIKVKKTSVSKDNVPKGIIVSQYPPAGTILDNSKEITIEFEVSDGTATVKIPDVSKMEVKEAEKRLKTLGLATKIIEERNEQIQCGYVIRTEPKANEMVKTSDLVTIIKSIGKDNNSNNSNNTTSSITATPSAKRKEVPLTVNLTQQGKYGDSLSVLVQSFPSDKNLNEIVFQGEVPKNKFPLELSIPVPIDGNSKVTVYIDNKFYAEYDLK